RIVDPRAWTAAALGGSLGAGEAYMEGWWECDDLTGLVRLLIRNRAALEVMDGWWRRFIGPAQRVAYWMQRNNRAGSKRNIAAHYDLSNEFFGLFLDPTMTYSCAVFENGARTLEEASVEKLDRLCRRLELRSEHHLLEIGTGWGTMALHAAGKYGCRVTTTTISKEQARLARERIAAAGLSDRVEVIERDYRDLEGEYDRIVSVEMIEAVGAEHYGTFFGTCARLLKRDGAMAVQAITIRDSYFARAAKSRDWLKKHIFPGSCLTSVSAMMDGVRRASDLTLHHLEDIGPHYATTLGEWKERFEARIDDVRAMGFDERFIRMWRYYLCYSAGAFAERHAGDVQMVLARPMWRGAREGWSR
ncbi:MAG: cyclopropane-fatty-acyl-phospholipid synthase family protein, partial [Planctomycetota bacterium]|nr:cyclopropane-fatty-acyl-phospholipid synthase family protein [Planctomycetota bacterium]